MGTAQKVKSLLVAPYDPLIYDDYLMIDKNRVNWLAAVIYISALTIIALAIFVDPPFAVMLVLPAAAIMFTCQEDPRYLRLIIKKRGPYVSTLFDYRWYSRELAEYDMGYRKKLIEYLDFLRLGEEQNDSIEEHINEWRIEAERAKNKESFMEEKMTAASFINNNELKEYKEFKRKYEQLVKGFNI